MKVKIKGTDDVMEVVAYIACNNVPCAVMTTATGLKAVELDSLELAEPKTYREHQEQWPEKAKKTSLGIDKVTGEEIHVDHTRDAVHRPATKNDGKKK